MEDNSGEHRLLASFIVGDVSLGIMFVLLRTLGFVDWQWKWVTCPFWAPLIGICVVLLTASIIAAIATVVRSLKQEEEEE